MVTAIRETRWPARPRKRVWSGARWKGTLERLGPKIELLRSGLKRLHALPAVKEVRQCGFIAGIEVAGNGAKVCQVARRHGLLTRPIRNVIVLTPPFCITKTQIEHAIEAIRLAFIAECTDS
jgi:adenosylmethionine-8-amino-7-oxononanoate aminotransferase